MKTLRYFALIVVAFCCSFIAMAQDKKNDAQKTAQKELVQYLRENNLSPTIDKDDNSVTFKKDGALFWVNISESNPVLYTLHRKGLNFENSDFVEEVVLKACNAINLNSNAKAVLSDKKVEFIIQTYAKKPEEYHRNFMANIEELQNINDKFKNIHNAEYAGWKKTNEDKVVNQPIGYSYLAISKISVGSVDANGQFVSNYDEPIRRSNCRYVVERIVARTTQAGIYKLGVKIYDPNGKLLLPVANAEYTTTQNIRFKKAKRDYKIDLPRFGYEKIDTWKVGEYRLEIYDFENGNLLHRTSFTVL